MSNCQCSGHLLDLEHLCVDSHMKRKAHSCIIHGSLSLSCSDVADQENIIRASLCMIAVTVLLPEAPTVSVGSTIDGNHLDGSAVHAPDPEASTLDTSTIDYPDVSDEVEDK